MAEFFKILKADPLGEPYTNPKIQGAKPVQSYWCQVEGQDKAVMIGKQVGNDLRVGMYVYGDLMYAKSQKGTEYWKFSSKQVPEGVQRPRDEASAPASTTPDVSTNMPGWFIPVANQIQYIYDQLKAMDIEATNNTQVAVDNDPDPEEKSDMPDDFLKVTDDDVPDAVKTVFGE